jgi:hypothetical protein
MKFFFPNRAIISLFLLLLTVMYLGYLRTGLAWEGREGRPENPSKLYLLAEQHPVASKAAGTSLFIINGFLLLPLLPITRYFGSHARYGWFVICPVYCYLLACFLFWFSTKRKKGWLYVVCVIAALLAASIFVRV